MMIPAIQPTPMAHLPKTMHLAPAFS